MKDTGILGLLRRGIQSGASDKMIAQRFCVIKFSQSIKEIEKTSDIDIRRGQKECPPASL